MLVKFLTFVVLLVIAFAEVKCEEETSLSKGLFSNELVEEGRTFARNVFKKMAVILPAIFFKLGISFTLLLLVTIVAVNNGFIGFLLLIVGMSTVLARLQEAKKPPLTYPISPISYQALPPVISHYNRLGRHHYNAWDRSDDVVEAPETKATIKPTYASYVSSGNDPYLYADGSSANPEVRMSNPTYQSYVYANGANVSPYSTKYFTTAT